MFIRFVGAFREGSDLARIRSQYYTEEFLRTFEKAWCKFIEDKVLGKWEMDIVGGNGKKLRVGDGRPPPQDTAGFPLTDDRRGDLYLIAAEEGKVTPAYKGQKWWLLKAWGVPVQFYREAWKEVPSLLSRGHPPMIQSAYALVEFRESEDSKTKVFLLLPVWAAPAPGPDLSQRLAKATKSLIENAQAKTKAKAKPAKAKAGASPQDAGRKP